eukprot:CAMPEP_0198223768 /NCGR_PEP_ID=MMETSP1445-20131203/93879_1 /TAXON_ID=36898 /ORGANISM="Pyramimonas sp., Strain CCMP2087" /LENGTH=61 /DNA_ID=CAMNT_0043902713 /DNA_START=177 /DNA_END=358 /DNA_ORIENTATION=-
MNWTLLWPILSRRSRLIFLSSPFSSHCSRMYVYSLSKRDSPRCWMQKLRIAAARSALDSYL